MLVEEGFIVRYFDDHPFGIGVYTFAETLAADAAVGVTLQLDEITIVTFLRNDTARNMRLRTFGRETWILYHGFPLDYQTYYYVNGAVEDFGQLSIWHNPRGNKKFVLVKAWIVDPKFVPKSLVMHQLGGARRSWTVPVIMLRSADWNAHIHDVPPPPEDPAPANGNPHPMHGPEITAEQLFQQHFANWLQQNMQFGGNNGGNNQNVQHMLVPDHVPLPVQEDNNLADQGVHFSAGVHPPINNLTDSPMQAWNDSISSSSSSGGSAMSVDALDAFHINSFTEILSHTCMIKSALVSGGETPSMAKD
jgi:hypothetical protein